MATRPIKSFKSGTAVIIRIEVRDATQDTTPLYSPSAVPTILLRDPNGNVQVNYGNMTEVETGIFNYTYQTTSGTSKEGIWRATFRASSGAFTINTPEVDVFNLIPY